MDTIVLEFLGLVLKDLSILYKVLIFFNIVQFLLLVKFVILYRIDLKRTRELNRAILLKISRLNALINYVLINRFEKSAKFLSSKEILKDD